MWAGTKEGRRDADGEISGGDETEGARICCAYMLPMLYASNPASMKEGF